MSHLAIHVLSANSTNHEFCYLDAQGYSMLQCFLGCRWLTAVCILQFREADRGTEQRPVLYSHCKVLTQFGFRKLRRMWLNFGKNTYASLMFRLQREKAPGETASSSKNQVSKTYWITGSYLYHGVRLMTRERLVTSWQLELLESSLMKYFVEWNPLPSVSHVVWTHSDFKTFNHKRNTLLARIIQKSNETKSPVAWT